MAADTLLGIGAPAAVITDCERLAAVAGGSLDGRTGSIAVLAVKDGAMRAKAELPARATENGLALSGGRIVVACEDGQALSFGP